PPTSSFTHTPPTHTSTLSLHDALPISTHAPRRSGGSHSNRTGSPPTPRKGVAAFTATAASRLAMSAAAGGRARAGSTTPSGKARSEEHTSELQSPYDLVCRLLLEKKKE